MEGPSAVSHTARGMPLKLFPIWDVAGLSPSIPFGSRGRPKQGDPTHTSDSSLTNIYPNPLNFSETFVEHCRNLCIIDEIVLVPVVFVHDVGPTAFVDETRILEHLFSLGFAQLATPGNISLLEEYFSKDDLVVTILHQLIISLYFQLYTLG